MLNVSVGDAAVIAVLGYAVVFVGLVLLMLVMIIMSKALNRKKAAADDAAENAVRTETAAPPQPVQPAPGSAGELKLYDTDPKDAAMIMAIVADTLGRPVNELRFISIREVKE